MAKQKKGRLTRIVSFLNNLEHLEDECFEEGELTDADFVDEGDDFMTDTKKEKMRKATSTIAADAFIGVGAVAAFMLTCSAVYYGVKGTVGLFKALGYIGNHFIRRPR